jgi:hypothetical protein
MRGIDGRLEGIERCFDRVDGWLEGIRGRVAHILESGSNVGVTADRRAAAAISLAACTIRVHTLAGSSIGPAASGAPRVARPAKPRMGDKVADG